MHLTIALLNHNSTLVYIVSTTSTPFLVIVLLSRAGRKTRWQLLFVVAGYGRYGSHCPYRNTVFIMSTRSSFRIT